MRVGPYRVVARLGSGGMGRVYLARTPGGRSVAVKVVHPELARDPEFRLRLAREVAAARAVDGRFTAQVLDAGVDDPTPWLSTVFVPGMSLAEAVAEHGPFPEESALALARGLAAALAAVHAAGLVHRDLKPSNVLLGPDGPRVIDFGISRATEASALTRTGMTVGSPGFMSPEQAGGGPVGAASDVFSFGTVLAFTLTGESPFGTGATPALLYRVVHAEPRLEGLSGVALDLVRRCLAKDPAARPTPAVLLAELSAGPGGVGVAGVARPDGSAWLPPAVAGSLLARASSALEADSGPTGYEPTRVDADPAVRSTAPARGVPGPGGGPTDPEPPVAPLAASAGRAPRPAGPRARLRTAPVLAAVAVVVAAAIGALAYTAGRHEREPEPTYVSQDDSGESPSDDTPSPTEPTTETTAETGPEPTDGGTTPEEPSPGTTDPFDGWSLADEADVRLPAGHGLDASDFEDAKSGNGFDVDLHENGDLAGADILLLKGGDSDVNSDCLADEWASGYGTLVKDSEWGVGDRICVRSSPDVLLVLRVTDTTNGQDASMTSLAELWKRQ
ncbi:serine/threonine protein kinase [Streptomyces erythrochromogenes]|uniref:serine/threonine protein kinase n=1 Tax=Streptomyces erythrochromogenes TaxID=285574 RepID=UPI003867B66B|nr:serine/threonine protein kinase [Streptomyces erythrochromogenes]